MQGTGQTEQKGYQTNASPGGEGVDAGFVSGSARRKGEDPRHVAKLEEADRIDEEKEK